MIQIKLDATTLSEPKVCEALSTLIKALSDYEVTLNKSKRSHQLVFENGQGSKVYLKGDTLHMLVEGSTTLPTAMITALSRGVSDEQHLEVNAASGERQTPTLRGGETADMPTDRKAEKGKAEKGKAEKGKAEKGKAEKGKAAEGKTAKGKQPLPSRSEPQQGSSRRAQRGTSKKTSKTSKTSTAKRAKGSQTDRRPKRHLRAEELSQWLQGLSEDQRRFVSALSTRGSLSVEESYQLLNVPQEQRTLKRLNGILGSIARWSSPTKDASLVVPWDAEGGAYVWRPELIKS